MCLSSASRRRSDSCSIARLRSLSSDASTSLSSRNTSLNSSASYRATFRNPESVRSNHRDKGHATGLEARRVELLARLEAAPPSMPRLHPNLAELYRQKVTNLAEALNDEGTRLEAAACIRELIEEIRLVPETGNLRV